MAHYHHYIHFLYLFLTCLQFEGVFQNITHTYSRFPAQIPKYFYCSTSAHSAVTASTVSPIAQKHRKHAPSQIRHNIFRPFTKKIHWSHNFFFFCHQTNIYHKLQMCARVVEHHVIRRDTATFEKSQKGQLQSLFVDSKTVRWFSVQKPAIFVLHSECLECKGFCTDSLQLLPLRTMWCFPHLLICILVKEIVHKPSLCLVWSWAPLICLHAAR